MNRAAQSADSPPFLFIPGACHGAWCWQQVLPFFNNAKAIDLPRDPAGASLNGHAQAILAQITRPAILVAHSAGGFAATAAAEAAPDRVAGLIYVCAYVPRSDESLAQMRRAQAENPMRGSYRLSPDRSAFTFAPERLQDLFYHDCPPDILPQAQAHLHAEPVRPQETALTLRHAPRLPRAYVLCTEDRAIPPAEQARMAAGLPCLSLPCGHSPFFALPDRLAAALHTLAADLRQV